MSPKPFRWAVSAFATVHSNGNDNWLPRSFTRKCASFKPNKNYYPQKSPLPWGSNEESAIIIFWKVSPSQRRKKRCWKVGFCCLSSLYRRAPTHEEFSYFWCIILRISVVMAAVEMAHNREISSLINLKGLDSTEYGNFRIFPPDSLPCSDERVGEEGCLEKKRDMNGTLSSRFVYGMMMNFN